MKKKLQHFLLFLSFITNLNSVAQVAGDMDISFNSSDVGFNSGNRANNNVLTLAIQTDGKIIIGGGFTTYDGTTVNGITRLNTDGRIDTTFVTGSGVSGSVSSIAIQADGKILIGGAFIGYNGTYAYRIARLNTDGSLDNSFATGTGTNGTVSAIAIQADGKILIGGAFNNYNGTSVNCIARLNTDGSIDTTFNTGTGANNIVSKITVQTDGKILLGGRFTTFNGTSLNRIVRLNIDGSLDTTFVTGTGANLDVLSIAIQNDGKILFGGDFTSYNGTSVNCIARLNTDGSIDTTFNTGTGANSTVKSIAIETDGKILLGGRFTTFNSTSLNRIVRLNIDGSLDPTFAIGTGANNIINAVGIQSDGKILIGGSFTTFNGTLANYITRLNTDGSIDNTFANLTGTNNIINKIAIQTDGKILIVGNFITYNGTIVIKIARLNNDGTLDTTFTTGVGANGIVSSIAIQADGKILLGGSFTTFNGTLVNRITRLNTDGSLDTTFNTGTGANLDVLSIAIQNDGKILIGGDFTTYNGTTSNRVARLNIDGSIDTSFVTGTGVNGTVYDVDIQNDGKILIGGNFYDYNGVILQAIARLNTDGSIDTTFTIGTGADSSVYTVDIQNDGKILLGGTFTTFNGTTLNRIARLNTNGSLDSTFTIGTGANYGVSSIAIQNDGKILIGGDFTTYNGTTSNRVTRLNIDGSLDTTFATGAGANATVSDVVIQSDGKIIIGGNFTSYKNIGRNRIARIHNQDVLSSKEFDKNKFKIYPNPTTNNITIEFSDLNNTKLEVIDITGKTNLKQDLSTNNNNINIEKLPSGIYLFKIHSDKGTTTAKVIKN